jgi:hypothetical protein
MLGLGKMVGVAKTTWNSSTFPFFSSMIMSEFRPSSMIELPLLILLMSDASREAIYSVTTPVIIWLICSASPASARSSITISVVASPFSVI